MSKRKSAMGVDPLDDLVPPTPASPSPTATATVTRHVTGDAAPDEAGGWEAAHKRVMVYFPRDLLQRIQAEARRSGRSKSQVVIDAVGEYLAHR